MSKHDNNITFHIMHSMKGGCGKSTCALFKALQLAKGTMTNPARVLFLDADFKGSAMQILLFRNGQMNLGSLPVHTLTSGAETFTEVLGKMPDSPVEGNGLRHTIAIPDNYRLEDNLNRYLKEGDISYEEIVNHSFSYYIENTEMSMNGYIDFLLSATDRASKDWFLDNYGKIGSGLFVYRMELLINKILSNNTMIAENNRKIHRGYTDVVVDMPPGYDEYSDLLLELLVGMATKDTRINLYYYAVTTEDIGHKKLALDNIKKVCFDRTGFQGFKTVNAIINTPYSARLETQEKSDHDIRVQKQIEDLQKLIKDKDGKVYINEYNDSYRAYCTIPEKSEFELEKSTLLETDIK